MSSDAQIWTIAALVAVGIVVRPFQWPEAIWAVLGAGLLMILRLLAPAEAIIGLAKGLDVYLFLLGMMLLAEVARLEGLFDWLAAHATRAAGGSAKRLFLLIYCVGILVTTFLSNDATAVVLTPAVAIAVRAAKVANPLPYLMICAFIANAASFVLPISNPANLVIYGSHMPPLLNWLPRFALPSLIAIIITFLALRWTQRRALVAGIAASIPVPELTRAGRIASFGLAATALLLLLASALDLQLGAPTAFAGIVTSLIVLVGARKAPWTLLRGVAWEVMPLVGGLFILVEALHRSGAIDRIGATLLAEMHQTPNLVSWFASITVAISCNLVNNLPAALISADVLAGLHASSDMTSAVLIGVDLGPNLSVTGSLATILWLSALRREGLHVGAWSFLKLGVIIMPPALILCLATLALTR